MPARFAFASQDSHSLPDLGLPEFAVAGRSNVGKSSLLGLILGQPKLVRTSRTPGRTQQLNLFVLDERYALVDLPGYGYAKLSKDQRAQLQRLLREYLTRRETLRGVLLLLDARREQGMPADRAVAETVTEAGRPLLPVITKIDLISKNRRLSHIRAIESALGLPQGSCVPASAKTGEGKEEILSRLRELAS